MKINSLQRFHHPECPPRLAFQEIKVVKPFRKTVELLLNNLLAFVYAGKEIIPVAGLEPEADFPIVISIVFVVLFNIIKEMPCCAVQTVGRDESTSA